MGDAPQCEVALMEHIDNILIALGKIANAGENVDEAFGVAMEIRHWLIGGKSCSDDLSKKLKFLNETVVQLENNVTEHTSADVDKKSIDTATVSTESSVSNGESYSDKSAHLSRSGRRRTGRRGRRPTRSAARDDDYVERRYPRSVVRYSDDDLISRVKRGQRTRRPARTFTPNWSLSPSPPPAPTKESTLSTKPATLARKVSSPLTKRTSLPSTPPITPTVLSPDSGRPSSNESTGNGAVNGKHLPGDTGQKDGTSNFEQCVTTPVRNLPSEAFLLPPSTSLTTKTTPLAPVALAPSTSFSTPVTTLSIAKAPQPPPLKLDEQSLLAIWKEKIELGDVRITLLNMLATNGTSHYHFIPLMLETIDKATAALDNKDMIAYAMHRAAIEVGCSELGNIMRSCNPADPTSQIATLATAMGLNPAPFTTMIQPSKMTTGLSPDVLVDLHEAATVVAAREKLAASSYTLPAQNVDNVQGYTERDITKYLL
ncbi:hypothetical protein KIN20_004360 [Parelaphostrongylus tenuis]|uniref:Uncharacterized protein n=1 Tax=Parelaphostrongylus tenuis TaxID=148309 RepID=A0AAD5MH69_PARTN|nr:hypothetical protein KIN20_004360 [Parelaphostrongylus tenuis]